MAGKPMSRERASEWLSLNAPNYRLLEWSGKARTPSLFLNIVSEKEFTYSFSDVKRYVKQGKNLGTLTTSKKEAEVWISKNVPHIKLRKWSGKASEKSLFFDETKNREFRYDFRSMKGEWKRNPGCLFGATVQERTEKQKDTCVERFGVVSNLCLETTKAQIKNTNLKKYGFEYATQAKSIKRKIRTTNISKFGGPTPMSSIEVRKRVERTNIEKYGYSVASKNSEIKKKIATSGIKTKISNGTIFTIGGKTISEIAKEKGCSPSTILSLYNKDVDSVLGYEAKYSILEHQIKFFLDESGIDYVHNKKIKDSSLSFRPDFNLGNLVIECDGLAFHSDRKIKRDYVPRDKNYHINKKSVYRSLGYESLFFRGDEIREKFPIVKSIILNKLGMTESRVYARKCDVREVSRQEASAFLEENHLMGRGSGRSTGLYHKDVLMSLIQVKWKNKDNKLLEISRFCNRLNHSVAGGWSRLISRVIKKESPTKIITFVDQRYGSGSYLTNLGWNRESCYASFKWTDLKNTFHRMKFRNSSGYEHGLAKIWDCGQAKYGLII